MAARTTIVPVNLNSYLASGGTFPATPSTGIDAVGAGNAFAAAWAGAATGVQFANSGSAWIWYYNGATPCNAYFLVGQSAGGDYVAYTTETVALNTSGYGWLGPWSPQKYNQRDTSQFGSAPGGAIGTTGSGLCCVDFSATGTLAVRLYQTIPAIP